MTDPINLLSIEEVHVDLGCKYCEYKAICRYDGDYRELKEFYNEEGKKIKNQDALDYFTRKGGFYE